MSDFAFLDPVTLTSNDNETLEGVVAHLGPVQFAPGSDWIGIRLTGPSIGKGKNDGTVKGVFYFDAGGEWNGMFVKALSVEKRELSKLEGLRLKRELGEVKSASKNGGSSASISPVGGAKSPAATPVRTRSKISAPSSAKTTTAAEEGGSRSDRMEKLRARREALTKEREKSFTQTDEGKSENESTTDADKAEDRTSREVDSADTENSEQQSTINLATATPGYKAELHRLQSTITQLKLDLKKKEAENASLQSSLDFMSKGAEQSTHDAVRMYALGALALSERTPKSGVKGKEKETPSKAAVVGGDTPRSLNNEMDEEGSDSSESEEEDGNEQVVVNQAAAAVSQALVERNNELMSQLSDMASEKTPLMHQLEESSEKISNMQHRLEGLLEKYEAERAARREDTQNFNAEKASLASQISSMEREYKILQDRLSSTTATGDTSALSFAKLKAELNSLQRKNEELNEEKIDMETTLEELVLGKNEGTHFNSQIQLRLH